MPWGGKRVKPPDKGRATGVGGVGGAMEPLPKASGRSVRGLLALERKQNDELRFTIERWEEAAEVTNIFIRIPPAAANSSSNPCC